MKTMFMESTGEWSMRRVLAFLFALSAIAGGILSIVFRLEWKVVGVAFGVPALIAVILLFFTTWGDVAGILSAARDVKK